MSMVYGPVPSRRLGQSLGIDPIPFKTCNYNCVYCQLGRTTPVTHERKDFFPPEEILAEVRSALAAGRPGQIDHVTFVGQGEPLLCASLGLLVRAVKAMTDVPVAVITNGSLIFRPEVREELSAADVVMPTLDAADQATFRRIARPWSELRIHEIIDGMVAFREVFRGRLWVEVMLVRGVNDSEPVLFALASALERIRPDQVHLGVAIRPPAEVWVEPPDPEGMMRAMAILGEVAPILTPAEGSVVLAEDVPADAAAVEVLSRHPLREEELVEALGRFGRAEVRSTLAALEAGRKARRHLYRGQVFWEYTGGRFGGSAKPGSSEETGRSQAT